MKKILLVWCCALFITACGAGNVQDGQPQEPASEDLEGQGYTGNSIFMDFNEFYGAIVFKDGSRPRAEYRNELYYDSLDEDGIKDLQPRKFYNKYRSENRTLSNKLYELSKSTQVFPLGKDKIPVSARIHNELWTEDEDGVLGAQKRIELLEGKRISDLSKQEAQELAYGYSLLADYASANKLVSQVCKVNSEKCVETIDLILTGEILDGDGLPVSGARIEVLNFPGNPDAYALTGEDGVATLTVPVRNPEKIRVRVSKSGYSDAFMDEYIVMELDPHYRLDFSRTIFAAHGSAKLDLSKGARGVLQVSGMNIRYEDGAFEIETAGETTYTLRDGQVKNEDGRPYKGKITLDVFDFTDQSQIMDEFLRADVVSEGWVNIDNQFITYGMPYFIIRDEQGGELQVTKDDPVTLRTSYNKIPGKFGPPEFFSEDEWERVVAYSSSSSEDLPLSREKIGEIIGRTYDDNNPWATWWVLRRDTGVWEPAPFKILNIDGDMIAQSYTRK